MNKYIQWILFGLMIIAILALIQQTWTFNNRVLDLLGERTKVELLEKRVVAIEDFLRKVTEQ